jgi:hypothetical protein
MAFGGANIYSLVAGFYPILADLEPEINYSQNTDHRQAGDEAPTIYRVGGPVNNEIRKGYIQGHKIVFADQDENVLQRISRRGETILWDSLQQDFEQRAQNLQDDAQGLMNDGELFTDAIQRQVEMNPSAASGSIEEHFQPGSEWGAPLDTEWGGGGGVTGGSKRFDFYNTAIDRHLNVTISDIRTGEGHGMYGQASKDLVAEVATIDRLHKDGHLTEEQKYDHITGAGIEYYSKRAKDAWNPIIRHAVKAVRTGPLAKHHKSKKYNNEAADVKKAIRQTQPRHMGKDFRSHAAKGIRNINRSGVSNFGSMGAKKMLQQHLGNEASYNRGSLESMPIAPHVFGFWGPFILESPKHPTTPYEYKVNEIDGFWAPGYFATLHEDRGILNGVSLRTDEAQAIHKAGVNASHQSGKTIREIGGAVTVAMGGLTGTAHRLYPEINIHHANEQFSDMIDDTIANMRSSATIPTGITDIVKAHMERYSFQFGKTTQLSIWASPYLGFIAQKYTAGTPIGA